MGKGEEKGIDLQPFKLDMLEDSPIIVMVAKRGSGKSVLIRHLLEHYKDIVGGVLISPTEKMTNTFSDFMSDSFIYHEYKTQILEKIFERQRNVLKKIKDIEKRRSRGENVKPYKHDPRIYLIMDDCLADNQWIKDKLIKEIFFNGRHYKIIYILTVQYLKGIPPGYRNNVDHYFLFANDNQENLQNIYKTIGAFNTYADFHAAFEQTTTDYGIMVVNNKAAGRGFDEKIMKYRIPRNKVDNEIPLIGCEQFKKLHSKNYDEDWQDKELVSSNIPKLKRGRTTLFNIIDNY